MKTLLTKTLSALLLLNISAFAADFTVKLNIENGHVGELYFGCAHDASDAYDKNNDIYVPPPAMTGYFTGFVSTVPSLHYYKDIRSDNLPQAWNLFCIPQKTIAISWDPKSLPEGIDFKIQLGNGNFEDMRKISKIKVSKKGTTCIKATKSEQKETEK